ncbi:carotenoid oxygenase family protein [Nocardia sp. alder85J]|uniref:carotenoid oxygenase family protein n=1 Tax=Nocardia sp. alder85J TaxID=2862949 RepID=UPI001CD485A5|nr:carotenoid oxygenase family protein [Nocardia sp. alder85J]MCX4097102.1 carotenoid oxygenase family protein [Nocardia sp. alder85J]
MTVHELPGYLRGDLAPVPDEVEAVDLPVTGVLPPELTGRYVRNGPNPRPGADPGHWFLGDGMLHGVRLREGRAEWYRNRWVRTSRFTAGAPYLRPDLTVDLAANAANTNLIRHGGRLYALVENGLPYEVDAELATVGACDFGGRLTTAMTAHPKTDPATGELHFFGYGFREPWLTYHRLSATGELVHSRVVEVPGPTMMHDFAITANHVVWLDLPVVFDLDRAGRGGMPYGWDDDYGARLGVMPKAGGAVTWYEVDPCYIFHLGNAHERPGGAVVVDAVRYSRESFTRFWSGTADREEKGPVLYRWILGGSDTGGARVIEEKLDGRSVEFPTINNGKTGLPGRYIYAVTDSEIVKYDLVTGAAAEYRTGGRAGEAVFVPAAGGAEDAGWLVSIVTGPGAAELLVLDAAALTAVASVRLPRRVPAGFHGHWLPDPP